MFHIVFSAALRILGSKYGHPEGGLTNVPMVFVGHEQAHRMFGTWNIFPAYDDDVALWASFDHLRLSSLGKPRVCRRSVLRNFLLQHERNSATKELVVSNASAHQSLDDAFKAYR